MSDAEGNSYLQGKALGIQPITWAGDDVLCCPHQQPALSLCLKDPNFLAAPGAAPVPQPPPSSSSWSAFEKLYLKWSI